MRRPNSSLLTLRFATFLLSVAIADDLRGETPVVNPAGTVTSIHNDGSTEVKFEMAVPLQRHQQLLVYSRRQNGIEPTPVATFRVASVRDDHVFGTVRSGRVAVGDIVPLPRFLDHHGISEAASLRDYAMKIAELDATIEALRGGKDSFHAAFRKSLEADRIAATVVALDAKRQVEKAVAEARRQQSDAETAATGAINRATLADQTRKLAEEDLQSIRMSVNSLQEEQQVARRHLSETVSLVERARSEYADLLDLKVITQKEVAAERSRILREREDIDKERGELDDDQSALKTEREIFAKERDEGLRRIAERLATAEETFIGDLRDKWEAMDDGERAAWLLIRLSSADGFKDPDSLTAGIPETEGK